MEITVKDKTLELDLGIGFALQLDSKFKFKQKVTQDLDVEFGLGVQLLYGQLKAVSIQAIVDFFNAGLSEHSKKDYPQKQLNHAIQEYAKELGGFAELADKCIEELQEVGLYQHIFENHDQTMNALLTKQQEKPE